MRKLIALFVAGGFAAVVMVAMAAPAPQQRPQIVGPDSCLNCHYHDPEKEWYSKKELLEVQRLFPDKGANAGHINSLKQLDTPKSDTFAKAIGLADKYNVKGACVQCHGTVFGGDANAGVSCESCHGPSSAYLTPHQVTGQYEASVALGMTKLIGNVQGWTQQCTNCHVMDDDRLIKAGHPSGDDFDLSKRFLPVSPHFKKKYSSEAIEPIAKAEMEGIIRRRRPNSAPPPLPPAPAPAPAPEPPPPPPPAAGAAAPAAKPKPRPVPPAPAPEPPGSPTSIEPPPPPPAAAPVAAAAPAPAPAPPPAAAAEPGLLQNPLVWGGAVLVLAIGGFLAMRKKK